MIDIKNPAPPGPEIIGKKAGGRGFGAAQKITEDDATRSTEDSLKSDLQREERIMNESQSIAKSEQKPPQTGTGQQEASWHPLALFRNEMDRLFDGFWRRMGPAPLRRTEVEPQPLWRFDSDFGFAVPSMDLVETDKEFRIKAELPGMDASNVELGVSGDVLTIKGEKRDEREEKAENFHLSERRFGSFRRAFQLHPGVDVERIEAKFDKGVLTVTLPKTAEAASRQRKIEVKSAS